MSKTVKVILDQLKLLLGALGISVLIGLVVIFVDRLGIIPEAGCRWGGPFCNPWSLKFLFNFFSIIFVFILLILEILFYRKVLQKKPVEKVLPKKPMMIILNIFFIFGLIIALCFGYYLITVFVATRG